MVDEVPFLKQLITSLSVTDRPDLMVFERKGSETGSGSKYKSHQTGSDDSGSEHGAGGGGGGRESVSSLVDNLRGGGGTDDDLPPPDPTNMALPTLMMAGTIIGSIFRADLSKNKVDVETNNLRKSVKVKKKVYFIWYILH